MTTATPAVAASQRPDSCPADDASLVERLCARDKSALDELVRVHGGKLYGVAMQVCRHEADAQDALQEALLQIWNKIELFERRASLSTWMYRVTANAALMKLRREKKFQKHVSFDATDLDRDVPVIQLTDPGPGPDATAVHHELGDRVRAAIEALPEPYRSAVLLSDVDGLTMEEIADATDTSVAAVKSRLHRGRLALRKVLAPYLRSR
jgi:RNA polymerase sigma-70 factor (ECF subfamily)